MSIFKKIYDKFKLKYERILSDTNERKYFKKKYDFKKYLLYFLFMYFLSISIFIIIWTFKNENYKKSLVSSTNRIEDIFQSSDKNIKNYNFKKYRFLSSFKFNEDTENIEIILNPLMNILKLAFTKILKKEKSNLYLNFEKQDQFFEDNENEDFYFIKLINNLPLSEKKDFISLIRKEPNSKGLFQIHLNIRDIRNLVEFSSNSTDLITNSTTIEIDLNTNDNKTKLIDVVVSGSNSISSLENKITESNIDNLVLIQGLLILLQSLFLITFISLRFVKIHNKYIIYKAVSFLCSFNNFFQFQLLKLIVTKIYLSEFHARFTIPYIHSAITVFFTMFIDSDYIVNSVAATIAGVFVILFSIGYHWMNDLYFLVGAFLTVSYCYFTFVLEINKKHLFLVDENNKNSLKNLMNTLENLNSGMIVYCKKETFECNKKFVEIFKMNLNFANKEDLDQVYIKFILFTNLTEFNTSLGKSFIKTFETFHQKFVDHEKILFELIISIEELKKLEEKIIIDKLINIGNEKDEFNDQEFINNQNENNENDQKENGNTVKNGYEPNLNDVNEVRPSKRLLELPENGSNIINKNQSNPEEFNISSGLPQRRVNNYQKITNEENKMINKNNNPNFDSSLNNLLDVPKVNYMGAINIPSLNENEISFNIMNQKSKDYSINKDVDDSFDLRNYPNNNHLKVNKNEPNVENKLLITTVKSGELKELIKKKSLRNTLLIKNKNQISDINGLQQSIYDLEKKKEESNLNMNIYDKDDKYNLNNKLSSNSNNYNSDLKSLNHQSIENIVIESKMENNNNNNHSAVQKVQPNPSRRRKSLYNTLKENELRASNNEKLDQLRKKTQILREKLALANQDFDNFKNFFFNNINTDQYTYFATKKFCLDNEDYTYRIYFRYNDISDSMEFLIDDLSTVLRMEDLKSQFKYKKYFLDKFSHEFRNPILNIKELVKNVKLLYRDYGEKLQNALKIEKKDSNFIINFLGNKSKSNKNLSENVGFEKKITNITRNITEDLNKTNIFVNEGLDIPSYKLSLNNNEDMISSKSVELKTPRKSAFSKAENFLNAKSNQDENNKKEINETLISKNSENAFKINYQTSRIVMRKTGEFFRENYNNINNNFNNNDSSSNNINYNCNLNNPENNLINHDSNNIVNFSLKKINKEHENVISNKNTLSSRETIYHKNSLDKKLIESNLSCSYYDNINNNDLIYNNNVINRIPQENSNKINKCNQIIDYQSIKDSFLNTNKYDGNSQILLNNARRIIIMDETHENIYSDLHHIKNLCEYMSLLISDFDFISKSQNAPLARNKTITSKKSMSFNTNRNNNSNDNNANSNNKKNKFNKNLSIKVKELENPESLSRNLSVKKNSIELNMSSNRYSVLNKEYYVHNNFSSNNAVLGSGIINKNSRRENDLEKTSFEILKFIKYFIKIFQTKIFLSDKNITLEYSIGGKVPEKITHDQAKIKLIIFNLLCNSVKFTSSGIIKIEVDTDTNNLIFNILDSGIGIKQENTDKLLKPINIVNICEETLQGGMGMGFYVTRKYLDLLQGTITINSFYGLGTLIELKIPFNFSRVTSNYTLLLNERITHEHLANNLVNVSPYIPVNLSNIESKNKPVKYLSHMLILDKKLKDQYEISSVHFDKSKTQHQEAYENPGPISKSNAKKSLNKNTNFKNLKTNQNVININNNFYNNRINLNSTNTNSNANKLRELNTELYNTNIFRPNMIDEMRSTSLVQTNSITNGNYHYNNNPASPASTYTKKTFGDKESKTIVLTDQNFIMNYNCINQHLNDFISNQNINENFSMQSENGDYSNEHSNICYSQEDLKETIKITNYNFNLNNISMEEKDESHNNVNHIGGDSKLKNVKSDGNQLNLSLANKFKHISNNVKQKRYSKSISDRKHKYVNDKNNGNTDCNNYSNINRISNFSSSNNLSNRLNKKNSVFSNNNSTPILNKLNSNHIKNHLNKIDSGVQNGERGLISNRKMVKYSQKKLNNFVSFENAIRILLVDDERLIRQSGKNVINKYFKKKGINYEIEECTDGVECLFKIYEGIKNGIKYDLIITDETMNFMKGSSTAEILRNLMNDNKMYFLKIIMVTSYEISTISPSVKKNLDKIFTKPLSINTLDLIFT